MGFIVKIIRIIFLPLKYFTYLLYGPLTQPVAGYSWYTKKDYYKMLKTAQDGDNIMPFNEWKTNAKKEVTSMRNQEFMK